jgi:hypothetical protein
MGEILEVSRGACSHRRMRTAFPRRLLLLLPPLLALALLAGCTTEEAPPAPYAYAAAPPCPPPPPSWAGGDTMRQSCSPSGGLFIYPPGLFSDVLPRYYYVPGVYPPLVIGGNP